LLYIRRQHISCVWNHFLFICGGRGYGEIFLPSEKHSLLDIQKGEESFRCFGGLTSIITLKDSSLLISDREENEFLKFDPESSNISRLSPPHYAIPRSDPGTPYLMSTFENLFE
jgi:hypothetical protein